MPPKTKPKTDAPPTGAISMKAGRLRPDAGQLHLICTWLQRRVEAGESWRKAALRLVRRHNGRPLRNGQTLRLSFGTLRRHYAQWLPNPGKRVFAWQYVQPSQSQVSQELKRDFLAACHAPGICSEAAAVRLLRSKTTSPLPTDHSFYRICTPAERREIHRLHRARLNAKQAERSFLGRLLHQKRLEGMSA